MISSVLFLAIRMGSGFGVSVVIEQLARCLRRLGVTVSVGCLDYDGTLKDLDVRTIAATPQDVSRLARTVRAGVVVAQTSPFFEVLPSLIDEAACWAWEHGDPSPAFFDADGAMRAEIVNHKRRCVYPVLNGVIVSSEFLRGDIGFAEARVIPLACDHAPDLGLKSWDAFHGRIGQPLRVGTLMRLGAGEARYKGNELFVELKRAAHQAGIASEFHVMGRGTPADAVAFERAGMRVQLNSSDSEKFDYLRGLDVFVSCSLWEGFNLPLVEAQAMATAALGFDAGAHPEVTPLLVSSIEETVALLAAYAQRRTLLQDHSARGYQFVRRRFSWERATTEFLSTVFA